MADGVFTIHPRWRSSVTCTLGESSSVKFYVHSSTIDWNEPERVKIAYANSSLGGTVSGEQRGLVGCKWDMTIFGTSQADVMSQFRTLTQALVNQDGGSIQYRPRGLDSGVMSTYYHYLQSSPPVLMRGQESMQDYARSLGQADRTHQYAIRCRCNVLTEAWATSDPETLVAIVSQTSMQNRDDGSYDNHLTIANSSIKGDALIPVIEVEGDSGTDFDSIMVHKRRMIVGSNTNLDWKEAEDSMGAGFSNHADAAASDGNVAQCTGVQGYLNLGMSSLDSTYLGNISVIGCIKIDSGTTYTCEVYVSHSQTVYHSQTKTIVGDGNWHLYFFSGYSISPGGMQRRYDDSTSPSIGDWSSTAFAAKFDRTVGSGNAEVDFWIGAKENEFLGTFAEPQIGISTTFIDVFIDPFARIAWGEYAPGGSWHTTWANNGPDFGMLYMHKGFDYRLRFLGYYDTDSQIVQAQDFHVTVTGLYATIFPFEES